MALATGCKKELDDYYTEVGPQLPTLLGNVLGTTKYAPGETVSFELQFAQQASPIEQIVILQKIAPARDSTVVQTVAYAPAFSRIKNADTLVVKYVVPAGSNKALVRVDTRVDSDNGQTNQSPQLLLPAGRSHAHHRHQRGAPECDAALGRRPRRRGALQSDFKCWGHHHGPRATVHEGRAGRHALQRPRQPERVRHRGHRR